ncbi:hypothetical protein BU16DRAFT_578488 [Lophium mytilinum]|uniref:Leucine-rich repeat domain-containing protein n=1 Tax=Lophium mytilinum TaxID=390894 RepID=A0A6A6R7W2_9PEZI|nr:hypothetical protein BU16DRAFT_578488 [Lophium mytilinum]
MSDPSHLPKELFHKVISYAIEGRSDVKSLCKLSLIDHGWHDALEPRIYSRWLHDGTRSSISSLWKFFRTIICSERIANQVRTLHIRNWTFGLVHGPSRFCFPEHGFDVELVRDAIRRAGIEHLEQDVMEALRKSDPRPLMALLLACLPKLTTLYAHVPETDIFLAAVLEKALQSQLDESRNGNPLLQQLCEIYLSSAWNYRKNWDARESYQLTLRHLWPVFQLPSLKKVSLFDLDPLGASLRYGNIPQTSGITDLTLVLHEESKLAAVDAAALLASLKDLTSLSLYLVDHNNWRQRPRNLSNFALWESLRPHRHSIEHFDLYRHCVGYSPPVLHPPLNGQIATLREFTRLKSLCIQAEALVDGYYFDRTAVPPLRYQLPPNIEFLTICGDEGLSRNKFLGEQLQQVVRSTAFPRLNRIILETTSEHIAQYDNPADPPHEAVERVCRDRGVQFRAVRGELLTRGGMGLRYRKYIEKSRREMIQQTARLRFALREHLARLGEARAADAGLGPEQTELLSDDLDSYELPWEELTPQALYPEYRLEVESNSGPGSEGEGLEESNAEEVGLDELVVLDERNVEGEDAQELSSGEVEPQEGDFEDAGMDAESSGLAKQESDAGSETDSSDDLDSDAVW